MRAELCKTCIHTKVCFHDKNLVGDTFVYGFSDAGDAWEKYTEWEKAGFPCDDYIPAADVVEVVRCGECIHWNAETKGCKRNPSVYRWYAKDFCSNGVR